MPTLTVNQPPNNLTVQLNQPFLVSGQATDVGSPEPHFIDSVTVQVDGGAPIKAKLTHVPDKKLTRFSFSASAMVTGGQDPHTVAVTATNDDGISVKKTVNVFTGPAFEVSCPRCSWSSTPASTPLARESSSWWARSSRPWFPSRSSLNSIGKLVAGPNLLRTTNDRGLDVLRVGIWIEDLDFPVVPSDSTYPLPRLLHLAATEGFARVPFSADPELQWRRPLLRRLDSYPHASEPGGRDRSVPEGECCSTGRLGRFRHGHHRPSRNGHGERRRPCPSGPSLHGIDHRGHRNGAGRRREPAAVGAYCHSEDELHQRPVHLMDHSPVQILRGHVVLRVGSRTENSGGRISSLTTALTGRESPSRTPAFHSPSRLISPC